MNSEYMEKLNNILKEYKTKETSLLDEYASITSIDSEITEVELSRIKEIKSSLNTIETNMAELEKDIKEYTTVESKISELEDIISQSNDVGCKYLIGKEKTELETKLQKLGDFLLTKYTKEEKPAQEETPVQEETNENTDDVENTKEEAPVEEVTEETPIFDPNKTSSRKILYAVVAVLAALGITVGIASCNKQNKKQNVENNTSITEVDNTVIESGFVNIDDEEAVYTRASEIKSMIDSEVKANDYTIDEIENILKWINGGVPTEVGQEEALFAISRVENLMNLENSEEVKNAMDYSMFFLDGTQGKELASKIYNSKSDLMDTKGSENFKSSAEDFTKLMVNSWVLNGSNNEISSYVLETSGMKALIDKYFLNTYAYINIPVEVEVMGSKFDLDKIAEAVNEANCKTKVTADNGETFDTYMNKFSSDMIGMVTEATLNKNNVNTLKLN